MHSQRCKLLDVIHEFEFWSGLGLQISIPKSLAIGAMYGTGTARRQKGTKADAAKRKRDAGPDILNPQIQALGAMDEALDADNCETQHGRARSLANQSSNDVQTMPHLQ